MRKVTLSLSLRTNSEFLTHMSRDVQQEVIFLFLQLCVVHYEKKNLELQVVLLMEGKVQDDGEV